MTKRDHLRQSSRWMSAFYAAMFDGTIRYNGNGQFIGFSLLKNSYPRQLGLDIF